MPKFQHKVPKTNKKSIPKKDKHTAQVARKVAKQIVKADTETKIKAYDFTSIGGANFSSFGYGSAASLAGLVGVISAGTGSANRVGDEIYVTSVKGYLAVQNGDNTNYVRIMIVCPKESSQVSTGATLLASVLSGNGSSGAQWGYPIDTTRYQVLFDEKTYLHSSPLDGSTATTVSMNHHFNIDIPVNKRFRWDQSGNLERELVMIGISDSAAVAHPGAVAGWLRVFFKDA